jgi:amino acid adenylation domain-containing protein
MPPRISLPLILDARLEAQRAYWLDRLSGGVSVPLLPAEGKAEEVGDPLASEHLELDLGADLGARLEALAGGSRFLSYAVLLSGLAACFYRYGIRGRMAVGSPILPDGAVPEVTNAVAVVVDLRGESTFRQLLLSVREEMLAAYQRQSYPLDRLLRDLGRAGGASGGPLFSVLVALDGLHRAAPQVGQEVTLSFARAGRRLSCRIGYRPERLRRNDLSRFVLQLREMLDRGLRESRRPLWDLALLTAAERQLLVVELNGEVAGASDSPCLHQMFEAQVARTPDAIALTWRGEKVSYRCLDTRANRWAHRLRGLGVGPEVRVGLLLERSPHLVVALLAVLKAGGAYLPAEPGQPRERLRFLLADSQIGLVLTESRFLGRVPGSIPVLRLDGGDPAPGEADPGGGATADNLAYVLYTSGSTGQPKGVMVPHRGVVNYLAWCIRAYGVAGGEGCPVHSPIGFDLTITSLFSPLVTGRRVDLLPDGRPIEELCAALSDASGYSLVKLTPSHLEALAHWLPAPAAAHAARTFVIGGEELRQEHLAFLRRAAPRTRLVNEYGPTEAVVGCCVYEVPAGAVAPGTVPIGRPIAGARLLVLDSDLEPVPMAVAGELFIGGVGLARGYLGLPERTAERFVPDPFSDLPGARLYRTGDLVRWRASGNLEFLGRGDHQVKIQGHRVELGEIEAVLVRHPRVEAAVVSLREDLPGRRLLVAYVVSADGDPAPGELRAFLGERLPVYMVPQAFLALAALPLTGNGKIDRAALPALAQGTPVGPATAKSPVEELLLGIWREVLGRSDVGPAADFFALGGQSLLATRVAARVRDALGVEVAPSALFESPTLAGFSARIEAALAMRAGEEERVAAIERVPGRQEPVLTIAQEHLWFLDHLKPDTAAFNIPAGLRVKGRLDRPALARSFGEIVRRHEALRTLFPTRAGEPAPIVVPPHPWNVPVVDLGGLPDERREPTAAALASAEAVRPFDLARGPLLRVKALRIQAEEHLLLIVVHHIVSDGWSMAVLIGELVDLYQGFARGELEPLPELPIQYADYAAWQRGRLTAELFGRHLRYWQRRLAGAPQETSLPSDRPRPNVRRMRGALHHVAFPSELSGALRELASREGATLFMTLLAGFAVLLGGASGKDDIVIGTDFANRVRTETEGLIGLFVNQLALRIDASGDPTFRELMAGVRQVALAAYFHQEVPFGKLVESLRLARRPQLSPLFQVKLIVQNFSLPSLDVPPLRLAPVPLDSRTCQLDLVLAFWETPAGLRGWINYDTDLFETATVVRLFERYRDLLESAVARPDSPASHLRGLLARSIGERIAMSDKERGKSSFSRFKEIRPRALSLASGEELIEKSDLAPGQSLPLVLRPRVEGVDLPDWARAHRAELERELRTHGALLFRGFEIDSSALFERFAAAVCDDLFNENGEHPREVVSGNVYTPVFYPPDKHLLWHNENSFNMSWPQKIMFCCLTPPAEGGETPIVDSRQVFARLPPAVRERFLRLGVMYQRNFGDGLGLPWQTVFQVATPAEAESKCRLDRIEFDWRGKDRLRTRSVRPAAIRHPETGEMTWFNQAQHWHLSCLDAETRESMTALFHEDELPRHCYYGDGSPIDGSVMRQILDTYRNLEVCFPWQRGDVLLLDNLLTAHARNPFKGKREILVALGDMGRFETVETPVAAGTVSGELF